MSGVHQHFAFKMFPFLEGAQLDQPKPFHDYLYSLNIYGSPVGRRAES